MPLTCITFFEQLSQARLDHYSGSVYDYPEKSKTPPVINVP